MTFESVAQIGWEVTETSAVEGDRLSFFVMAQRRPSRPLEHAAVI